MLNLTLSNFRRFVDRTPIAFPKGLTLISGNNGVGKSTLVDSLIYALYGKDALDRSDVHSDGSRGQTCVECELVIDGHRVMIHRFSDRAALWIDGIQQIHDTPGSISEVTHELQQLMGGLTSDQFTRTYVALQGDTDGLVRERLQAERTARRQIIEGVLQLDVLSQAVKAQQSRRADMLTQVKTQWQWTRSELQLEMQAEQLLQQFEKSRSADKRSKYAQQFETILADAVLQMRGELEQKTEDTITAQSKVAELELIHAECEATLKQVEKMLTILQQRKSAHYELEVSIAGFRGQLQQLDASINRLEKQIVGAELLSSSAAEYELLGREIDLSERRLLKLPLVKTQQDAFTKAEQRLNDLDVMLQSFSQVKEELAQKRDKVTVAKHELEVLDPDPILQADQEWQQEKAQLDIEERNTKDALHSLQEASKDATCPTCGLQLTGHTRQQRIRHLKRWLDEQFPASKKLLDTQHQTIARQRRTWQQQKLKASETWQSCVQALATAQGRVKESDNLRAERAKAKQHWLDARKDWDELGETKPYDLHEKKGIEATLNKLRMRASELKPDALLYQQHENWQKSLEQQRADHGLARSHLENLCHQQTEIEFDPLAYEQVDQAVSLARVQRDDALQGYTNARLKLADFEAQVQPAQLKLQKAQQYQQAFQQALLSFQREDKLLNMLSDFQEYFFAINTKNIGRRASQLLQHAVTDQSILGIQFEDDRLYYLDASHVKWPVARLSGGERALLGLCLRIALAEQAQSIAQTGKVRLLILDEVLSSLDETRRGAVQQIFDDVLQRGVFDHIIMITHLDTVKTEWHAHGFDVQKIDSKASQLVPWQFAAGESRAVEPEE